jgi:hypothetical protein
VRRVGHPKGEQPAEAEHGGDQRDQDIAQQVAKARLPRSWPDAVGKMPTT